MKIKTLVTHVIDRAIDKVVQHVQQEDDSLLIRLAAKINPATLGEHIDVDYEDLAQAMDAAKVARHVEVDTEDIARHLDIDITEVANHLDTSDIAECLDTSDIADYIDLEGLAEYINVPARDVAEHIDYAVLAKSLNPMDALAASQDGTDPVQVVERLNLDSIAGKLLDAAVDRLLILANKSVEEDLAIEQAKTQEQERSTVLTNGQTDLATFIP